MQTQNLYTDTQTNRLAVASYTHLELISLITYYRCVYIRGCWSMSICTSVCKGDSMIINLCKSDTGVPEAVVEVDKPMGITVLYDGTS